ncbi:MAG: peroxidase family protein [Crocosphaera sp.]|nr:peroxidase family protein [Crocosphaera sp.]
MDIIPVLNPILTDESELMPDSLLGDDNYENNNTIETAFDLSTQEQTLLSEINGLGIALNDDFFEIEVTNRFLDLSVDLFFDTSQRNLDLLLFDATGTQIAASTSLNDRESIDLILKEPGTYYANVTSGEGTFSGNTYDLRWDDVLSKTIVRTFDGSYNNLDNPDYGKAHIQLLRLTSAAYEDGLYQPRGGGLDTPLTLPSAREISNAVADQQGQSIPNNSHLSDWFWQWGQFIDHDIVLTESAHPLDPFNISVPGDDPLFGQPIRLNRSVYDTSTGIESPRQQLNEITAFIDGSMVYGSNETMANALRTHDGTGKLLTSVASNEEVLLPTDADGNFMAGDIRVGEQLGLTAVHTLFVREHNRLAEKISQVLDHGHGKKTAQLTQLFQASELSRDDFIYQSARRLVGAEIQIITYKEFLPLLVGKDAIDKYTGYDETVNPSISTEFSTAAFRVGHTMLSPQLLRVENDGTVESIALRDAFFNPSEIQANGVDSLLNGLSLQKAQAIDNFLTDEVRNFLFGPPGAGGLDLASLNIQRGREHGIADINTVRDELGLTPYNDFDELTGGNLALSETFASVYESIDDVDLWIGGLAEQHVSGGVVGETFQYLIADQFTRLRDGDRFWYGNDPYLKKLKGILGKSIENVSLSNIIEANSDVDIVGSAFRVHHAVDI